MKKIRHEGLYCKRLLPSAENPRERVFAEQWKHQQDDSHTLAYLMRIDAQWRPDSDGVTQDEATVAATVVQWLGSNVGWSFLNECVEKCGFKLEALK